MKQHRANRELIGVAANDVNLGAVEPRKEPAMSLQSPLLPVPPFFLPRCLVFIFSVRISTLLSLSFSSHFFSQSIRILAFS